MRLLTACCPLLVKFTLPITSTGLPLFYPWFSHRDRLANTLKHIMHVKSTRANQRALE